MSVWLLAPVRCSEPGCLVDELMGLCSCGPARIHEELPCIMLHIGHISLEEGRAVPIGLQVHMCRWDESLVWVRRGGCWRPARCSF